MLKLDSGNQMVCAWRTGIGLRITGGLEHSEHYTIHRKQRGGGEKAKERKGIDYSKPWRRHLPQFLIEFKKASRSPAQVEWGKNKTFPKPKPRTETKLWCVKGERQWGKRGKKTNKNTVSSWQTSLGKPGCCLGDHRARMAVAYWLSRFSQWEGTMLPGF